MVRVRLCIGFSDGWQRTCFSARNATDKKITLQFFAADPLLETQIIREFPEIPDYNSGLFQRPFKD
jgi:hypothetical protein